MKITMISNLYPPHYLGGYEVLCEQISRKLHEKGHDITIIASDYHNPEVKAKDEHPFPVERILQLYVPFSQPAGLMRSKRAATSKYNYKITKEYLQKNKPDIVFVWSQLRLTLGSAFAAQSLGLPCAYTFNDEYISSFAPASFSLHPRQIVRYALDHFVYPQITLKKLDLTHTTSISHQVKRNLLKARVPIKNTKIIYQGIPHTRFPAKENIGSLNSPLSILYVGQLHHYKGVHTILEALTILKKQDFPPFFMTVVGDGPEEYKQLLKEKAGSMDVRFLGKIAHQELPQIYRDHDIFVFSSIWQEPFGLTHLEAMSSGTIVISTNDGGHGEFLEDQKNAFVFEKNNPEHLAKQLQLCIANPDKSRDMAIQAHQTVHEKFTSDIYANNLEKFLQEALRG